MTTPKVDPYSDATYRYHCPTCNRIGSGYYTEAMAQRDAGRHDCDNPKYNETTQSERNAYGLQPVTTKEEQ